VRDDAAVRTFETEERRERLGVRHHLARRAQAVEVAAADLVGLHSSDPATVFLSARARVDGFTPSHLEDALYRRRSLVRMLGMRRTLFVVPSALVDVVDAACTKALVPAQRRRLVGLLADQVVSDDAAAWLDDLSARTMAALETRGEATARELTTDVPDLATKLTFGTGKTWGGTVGLSTRLLFLLATEGRVVRARPLGSWTSGQYRWAPLERWLDGSIEPMPAATARAELLRRWLRAFGPATLTDVRWWTGWTARFATSALSAIGAVEVRIASGPEPGEPEPGWVLPDDLSVEASPDPWVALLPSLDPTTMGWKRRGWYLGAHAEQLFDRNGNAGPTIWADGRVVGAWAQASDGAVRVRMLERVHRGTTSAIEAERQQLESWLGGTRVRPRFRSPLERELSE
jgi:hypothetical protein